MTSQSLRMRARAFRETPCFALGIGAQKSATSWVSDWLDHHPDVHLFPGKEVHYWDAQKLPGRNGVVEMLDHRVAKTRRPWKNRLRLMLPGSGPARRLQALEAHRTLVLDDDPQHLCYQTFLMEGYRQQPVVAEFTPAYAMLNRAAFAEIDRLHPNTRYIFLMRDPVDRHISSVKHFLSERRLLNIPKGGATDAEFERRCLLEAHNRTSPVYQRGDYARTITELEAAVDPSRVFYGFFETIRNELETARLAAFLNIAPIPGEADRKVNAARISFDQAENDAFRTELESAFRDVYAFVRERFGTHVPEAWRGGEETSGN